MPTVVGPQHGRGSAAEQGAALRAKLDYQRASQYGASPMKAPTSNGHSNSNNNKSPASSPKGSRRQSSGNGTRRSIIESINPINAPAAAVVTHESRKSTPKASPRVSRRSSKVDVQPQEKLAAPVETTTDEKQAEVNVTAANAKEDPPAKDEAALAAAAAPLKEPKEESKPVSADPATEKVKAKTEQRPAATVAAKGSSRRSKPPPVKVDPKGRCYPLTGIDNLALLMDNDSFSTSCFSMYLFKTEIDDATILRFFTGLADAYPKYRYVVELDPAAATRKDKAARKAAAEGKDLPRREPTEAERRGRRTRFSNSIKAGSLWRPARWRLDETFDLRENIEILDECPGGKDEDALFELAGKFLGRHFDYTKPVWEALVVRGLETSEGARSALMVKVHHCFSDGQGMIMSYHSALGSMQTSKPIEEVQDMFDRKTGSGEVKKPGQRNIQPTFWGSVKHGFHTARGLYTRSRKSFTYQAAADNGKPSARHRVADRLYYHSEGVRMEDIKLIRQAFSNPDKKVNLSLNDVACGVLSRALRIAAERTEKGPIKDKRTAIFVPISLRPRHNWDLANFTTGGIAWFSFHDPKDRSFEAQLEQVNREMNRIKRSHWPRIWFESFDAICKRRAWYVPNYWGTGWFWARTYREYHVATNVPGPPKPVSFGEHEAYSYHVLPPSSPGKATLSIGMISYANDFSLAVSCDAVSEFRQKKLAKEICQAFQDAAAELVAASKAKLGQEK